MWRQLADVCRPRIGDQTIERREHSPARLLAEAGEVASGTRRNDIALVSVHGRRRRFASSAVSASPFRPSCRPSAASASSSGSDGSSSSGAARSGSVSQRCSRNRPAFGNSASGSASTRRRKVSIEVMQASPLPAPVHNSTIRAARCRRAATARIARCASEPRRRRQRGGNGSARRARRETYQGPASVNVTVPPSAE